MKVAALDLGTNTFLCLIVEIQDGAPPVVLADEVRIVRLGQDVDRTGRFHEDALARARSCFTDFRKLIDQHKVDRVLAVATSAARDVENGHELFLLGDEVEIPIRVIEGETEARLSYQGAVIDHPSDEKILVIDIGGGSTELIVGQGGDVLFAQSVDLGGVRLTERMVPEQPVPEATQLELKQFIHQEMSSVLAEVSHWKPQRLVAVAGTPSALAALELGQFDPGLVNGMVFSRQRLEEWIQVFANTSIEEKKTRYRLGGRADIIYAGASILLEIMEALGASQFQVSIKGLRYGLATQLARGTAI